MSKSWPMNINKTKPPKNREFLGLVDDSSGMYWEFFWWATKADGVNGRACFVDRAYFNMPNIVGWIEAPEAGYER